MLLFAIVYHPMIVQGALCPYDRSDEYARVQRRRSEKIPDAASSGPAAAPFTIRGEAV